MKKNWGRMLLAALLLGSGLNSQMAGALEFKVQGDMLSVSGNYAYGDKDKLRTALADGTVKYVVLYSPNGGWTDGKSLYEVISAANVTTVAFGHCSSILCGMTFLGGTERRLAYSERGAVHSVGLAVAVGNAVIEGDVGVTLDMTMAWWRDHTKLSTGFLARNSGDTGLFGRIMFFPPNVSPTIGRVLRCKSRLSVDWCDQLSGVDALTGGILTSDEPFKDSRLPDVQDLKTLPVATRFAALRDDPPLDFLSDECQSEYRTFLKTDKPRAFAVNNDGTCFATHSLFYRPYSDALSRCKAKSKDKTNCVFYAVDDQVVFPVAKK
ncbi:hypothetical protein [Viridibacterium curvum]|uniref:Uncharacterized protein n=1 Tax=Viridibacterium curvum TaxID=1101404 RepID=A0ABP9QEL0_9RHOO